MKKVFAILLALTLCLSAACALADEVQIPETAAAFDLSSVVPEGYTLTESTMAGELSIKAFEPSDIVTMPELCLTIAYSEEYAGVSLTKDLDDEQIKELYGLVDDSYLSDSYTVGVTDDGWKYLQVIDSEEDNGYATLLMIHDGYFIEVYVNYTDFRPMTEEDLTSAKLLLDSYVITEAE